MNIKSGVAIGAMLLSACSTQTILISGTTDKPATHQVSMPFFIYGLDQEQRIDASQICGGPDKIVKVEVQETLADMVVRSLTAGIYAPRDARIYCK
ncbi:MAG: Bor family protein [Methylococcales bacterium]